MICDLGKGTKNKSTKPRKMRKLKVSTELLLNAGTDQDNLPRTDQDNLPPPPLWIRIHSQGKIWYKTFVPKKIWIVTQYDKNKRVFRNAPRWRCTAIFNATAYSKVCFISLARQYCALNFWIIHQLNDNNIIFIMNISIKSEWIEFKSKLQYHSQILLDNLL